MKKLTLSLLIALAPGLFSTLHAQIGNTTFGAGGTLGSITTGGYNSAYGFAAANNITTGSHNVAIGVGAMGQTTSGIFNVSFGPKSLLNNTTGGRNIAIGYGAGTSGNNFNNTVAIGVLTNATGSNMVRLGNTAVTSIGGFANWTNLSDGRFKKDIKENVIGLEFITKLRPVSYAIDVDKLDNFLGTSKLEFYKKNTVKPYYQTGFIAQEVEALTEKVGFQHFNGVDKPDNEKDHYGIRYAEFIVPLVKAVQELNEKVMALEAEKKSGAFNKSTFTSSKMSEGFELYQNNPNPFTVATEIKMILPETTENAQIIVYNMEGRQLKEYTVEGTGSTSVQIEANELEAGMYIYALIADGKVITTKQMILTK